VHHHPTPVADIRLFKYDDLRLWVTDGKGKPRRTAEVQRGSGDASVHVLYGTSGSQLAPQSNRPKAPIPRAPGAAARHRAVARVSSGWRILLLIGLLNLVVLAGIVRVFASMRRGEYDEAELERQLANRGFFYRFFGRWMTAITKEWQLYPVGVVFGLGFDTASEVALLATTGLLASQHIPWYAIICLPILFTAGMTFMDTTDGLFMNLAYGWAFFNPIRKVYYNLAITGLSVAICFGIGAVEVLSLLPQQIHGLSRTTGFWGLISRFNINTAGFVIVGLFLAAWLAALLIWRYARIEEKWNPAPQSGTPRPAPIGPMASSSPVTARRDQTVQPAVLAISRSTSAVPGIRVPCLTVSGWWPR